MVYYVSPQVWAWRKGRIHAIRENVSRMLVIFPFEEDLYRKAGVPVTFVGHPLIDLARPVEDREGFLRGQGLDPARPVVALLPGSRRREIAFNLPGLVGAVDLLAARRPDLQFVLASAPAIDPAGLRAQLGARPIRLLEQQAHAALSTCDLALLASGTATIEAALLDAPMVVVYRLSRLTYGLGRRLVDVPHFAMVNLIAGRQVVSELIQGDFTPERVAAEALAVLDDPARVSRIKQDLAEVRSRLGGPGASRRAAEALLLEAKKLDRVGASV